MTIYSSRPTPEWDKSGEKRVPMPPEMAAKYKSLVTVAIVAPAKDGRWCFGLREAELRSRKKGDFATAAEAVAEAAKEHYIILNTAPLAIRTPPSVRKKIIRREEPAPPERKVIKSRRR